MGNPATHLLRDARLPSMAPARRLTARKDVQSKSHRLQSPPIVLCALWAQLVSCFHAGSIVEQDSREIRIARRALRSADHLQRPPLDIKITIHAWTVALGVREPTGRGSRSPAPGRSTSEALQSVPIIRFRCGPFTSRHSYSLSATHRPRRSQRRPRSPSW